MERRLIKCRIIASEKQFSLASDLKVPRRTTILIVRPRFVLIFVEIEPDS